MISFVEDRSVLTRAARQPDETARYGVESDHVVDLRFGTPGANRRPLIVMIHGGFWRPEYDRAHTAPMCEALAAAGWTTAAIEYRRIPRAPDLLIADVRDAVITLAAAQHGNGRVIVMGHSAGGHLCLYIAATLARCELVGAIALAPAADLQVVDHLNLDNGAVRDFLGGAAHDRTDLDPARLAAPPIPTTILHGQQDAIVPIAVAQSYVEHHPRTRLVAIEKCGHFALIDPLSAAWTLLLTELDRLSR